MKFSSHDDKDLAEPNGTYNSRREPIERHDVNDLAYDVDRLRCRSHS